jgi:hypothetical protein
MKKVILISAIFMTSLSANAQSTEQTTPAKSKSYYSFAWGLFKSKDYPKNKTAVFEFEKPKFSTSLSDAPLDTTKYEQKSLLWGAVKWTEKKKNTPPVNTQSNE